MQVCIHRGSHEIGGSCVELRANGKSLLLDLGLPLTVDGDSAVPLPDIPGLTQHSADLLGVVLSHPHQDHWGLVPRIREDIPVFMGQAAHRILRQASFFGAGRFERPLSGVLEDRKPLDIGPFRIIPFLNDHSAFDSYSLLLEAGGKRVFYSGDFRAHGRKAALFEKLVREPPKNIDVLLTEGTLVTSKGARESGLESEEAVKEKLVEVFREAPGPVLVAMSSQNIDRLVSVFQATLIAHRTLVVDLYAASIATATGRHTVPQPGFDHYRVWVPHSQRVRVKRAGEFDRVRDLGSCRIFEDEMKTLAPRSVVLFRPTMADELEPWGCMKDATLVWSLWSGYLEPPHDAVIAPILQRYSLRPRRIHCSGHAGIEDIQRLAAALAPARVVPMHTFGADRFGDVMKEIARVELHADGEIWEA